MKTILAILTAYISWLPCSRAEDHCPVCQGAMLDVTKQKDDQSKPSINLAVWNRSVCSNKFFGSGSTICPRDGYAYEVQLKLWELSLEDRDSFKHPLDRRIYEFPLPGRDNIKSRTVYSQEFATLGSVKHGLLFWTVIDNGYFAKVRQYAKAQGIQLNIEPHKGDGQAIVRTSVTKKTEHTTGADHQATKPAYKAPAKIQTPTPTSKDAPR